MILSKQKNRLFSLFRALFVRSSRNRRKFFVLGALVVFLFLFVPRPAHASSILGDIVITVLNAILYACKMFVHLGASLLAYMLEGNHYNFTTEPFIKTGWIIVRDICNLFFLLILIFIAFCTILQIEKYHAKKTLLTLIIMALLINFSKPIAIFIFDGSQLLMNYFVGSAKDMTTKINELSNIAEIVYNDVPSNMGWGRFINFVSLNYAGTSDEMMIAKQLTAITFIFMYAVALLVMALYLFIRLVALWVLIIVSPFAFLLAVVPDFKKYSDEWWSALFKYCYVGPILAFFLYLSTKLASSSFLTAAAKETEGIAGLMQLKNALQFIVVLVFLYASIIMAQKLGIAFASGITSGANKALKWGTGVTAAKWGGRKAWAGTKYAARAGASWTDRRLARSDNFGWLSPTVWKKTMAEQKAESERKSFKKPTGRLRDKLNKYFYGEETRHEEEAVQSVIAEKEKEHGAAGMDIGLLYEKYLEAKAANKKEDMTALLRLITSTNEGNSFMIKEIREERMQSLMAGGMSQTQAEAQMAHEAAFEPFKTTDRYIDQLMAAGFDEHMATKQVVDMGLVSVQKGMFQLHGAGAIDKGTRKYRRRKTSTAGLSPGSPEYLAAEKDIRDRVNDIQGKINETRAQGWADTFHWTSIFNQNADGSVGDIHAPGLNFLGNISGEKLQQLGRIRGDGVQRTYEGLDKIRSVRDNIQDTTTRDKLTKFIDAIDKGYRGEKLS